MSAQNQGVDGPGKAICGICKQPKKAMELLPAVVVTDSLAEFIRKDHPEWDKNGYICRADLSNYRSSYVRKSVEEAAQDLQQLDKNIGQIKQQQQREKRYVNRGIKGKITPGQRAADNVAKFGGSWKFIISFMVFILLWLIINTAVWVVRPFDPYPYILLNLVLSCIAAIQAPVIMMSQNRLEARDRKRAENDFRIDVKSEMEIRNIDEKLDFLISHQWQRLFEIQQIQTDLMSEFARKDDNREKEDSDGETAAES